MDCSEVVCKSSTGWQHLHDKQGGHIDDVKSTAPCVADGNTDTVDTSQSACDNSWSEEYSSPVTDESSATNSTQERSELDDSPATNNQKAAGDSVRRHGNDITNQSPISSEETSIIDNFETLRCLLRRGRRTSNSNLGQTRSPQRPLSLQAGHIGSTDSHQSPLSRDNDEGRLARWFSLRKSVTSSPTDVRSVGQSQCVASVSEDTETDTILSCTRSETLRSSRQLQQRLSRQLSQQLQPLSEPPQLLDPPPAGLSAVDLKRRHVLQCIVQNENNYLASLHTIVTEYKDHLEQCQPPLLSAAKVATVFRHITDIVHCHTVFRIALAAAVSEWDAEQRIGDVFVASFSKAAVLNVYSAFINNFSSAMNTIRVEAKRKSGFAEFLQQRQACSPNRLSLFGLMVKPVQRFPQFILQLQDLLKYTPRDHPDRLCLQLALTQLESLAEMLNEKKRESEQYQAFNDTLRQISGKFGSRSLAERGRHLLREDLVTRLHFASNGTISRSKSRRLYLLNDLLLCVSSSNTPQLQHPSLSGGHNQQQHHQQHQPQEQQDQQHGQTPRLTLKWSAPVCDVEVLESSASLTLSHVLTAGGSGGGIGTLTGGAASGGSALDALNTVGALCQEMSDLMHDYEVVSRIGGLLSSLRGHYQNFNVDTAGTVAASIQREIRRKDEQISWLDDCSLHLCVRSNSSNSSSGGSSSTLGASGTVGAGASSGSAGRQQQVTFQMESPISKLQWITDLRLTQLALHENNNPAWNMPDSDRPATLVFRSPLFVRQTPVVLPISAPVADRATTRPPHYHVLASCFFSTAGSHHYHNHHHHHHSSHQSASSRRSHHNHQKQQHQHYFWVCTAEGDQCRCHASTVGASSSVTTDACNHCWITVFSVQQQLTFREITRFRVTAPTSAGSGGCSRVVDMCHVWYSGVCGSVPGGFSTIWLATVGGHIIVYSTGDVAATPVVSGASVESFIAPLSVLKLQIPVTTLLPVECLCVSSTSLVYAAQEQASVSVLTPACQHNSQNLQQQTAASDFGPFLLHQLCLTASTDDESDSGEEEHERLERATVRCLVLIGPHVYAGCGENVFVIDVESSQVLRSFAVHEHGVGRGHITCMAHSGVGLWLSLSHTTALCLYHIETFRHLQDVDVAAAVCKLTGLRHEVQSESSSGSGTKLDTAGGVVRVTALSTCRGLLWAGTSVGVSLTVALPRLGGVPVVSGRGTLSYHAHCAPVRHIVQLTAVVPPPPPAVGESDLEGSGVNMCCHRPCRSTSVVNSCITEEQFVDKLKHNDDNNKEFIEDNSTVVSDDVAKPASSTTEALPGGVDSSAISAIGSISSSSSVSTVALTHSGSLRRVESSASSSSGCSSCSWRHQMAPQSPLPPPQSVSAARNWQTLPRGFGGSNSGGASSHSHSAGSVTSTATVGGSSYSLTDARAVYDMYGALLAERNGDSDSVSSQDQICTQQQQQQQHESGESATVVVAQRPATKLVRRSTDTSVVAPSTVRTSESGSAASRLLSRTESQLSTASDTSLTSVSSGGGGGVDARDCRSAPASRVQSFRSDVDAPITAASPVTKHQHSQQQHQQPSSPSLSKRQQQQQRQKQRRQQEAAALGVTGGRSVVTVVTGLGYTNLAQTPPTPPQQRSVHVTLHVWETRI